MAWNFVNSRRLQTGQRYGLWLTSTGVTSTDDLARWLRSRRWSDVTLLPRGTLATGQMVKEMHAIWAGSDGTVLPVSDPLLGYGPLYLAESSNDDPGDVPSRAPGERPPPDPDVEEAMRRANTVTKPNRWKGPALVAAAGLGFVLFMGSRSEPTKDEDDGGEDEEDATK
jgi:hypothetical protein